MSNESRIIKTSLSDPEVRGKIAIIVYEYGLGNSPSLINLANMLSKSDYDVDFFTYNTYLGVASFDDPHIQIHDHALVENTQQWFLPKAIHAISRRITRSTPQFLWVKHEEKRLCHRVSMYAESIASTMSKTHYKCLIGVEPPGLMAATILGKRFLIPYIYYNMELHSKPDIKDSYEWAVKRIEEDFHKGALFTITQDDSRAEIMVQENAVARDTMVTIPVCADGEPFTERTNILRDQLGIGADKIIVLYAGFLAEWAMCEEMARAAQSWPEKFVLILHSHGYDDPAYIMKLKKYEGTTVRFSDAPVMYEDLPKFLASADIGIAMYRGSKGKNFSLISSASGKIAHYLKSGLPIIVNDYPGISNIVESYHCGIATDSMGSLTDAIQKICDQYTYMRQGSFWCYEDRYRLSRHFTKLLDRLERI